MAAPQTAITAAAAATILPGNVNLDATVIDTDASVVSTNRQKQAPATWSEDNFNNSKVSEDDVAILAQHWMMAVEDMNDNDDDARDKVFASVGATDDVLGLYDE